jgi:hypothetical protein
VRAHYENVVRKFKMEESKARWRLSI